jgi:Family of unknown function (DUF5694)
MAIRALSMAPWAALFLAAAPLSAQAVPQGDPLARLQRVLPASERTQVMVLGTFHFRGIKDAFRPGQVESLLARLEAFKPDVVAVECMPGALIHELELRSKATPLHGSLLQDFASRQLDMGHQAQGILKLDMIEASKAMAAQAGPVDRTLHCLAAYELPSALLAWARVPREDPARARVPAALAAKLDEQLARVNEIQDVAIPLALRLGLQEIACVDEFEDLESMAVIGEELDAAMKDSPLMAKVSEAPVFRDLEKREAEGAAAGDLLPVFRHLNASATQNADVDAQWAVFLRTRFPHGTDRGRLALWENRNLKIAGRIRALTALHPGKRILVIYGASHKPFLEAYLGHGSDLQLVRAEEVLK